MKTKKLILFPLITVFFMVSTKIVEAVDTSGVATICDLQTIFTNIVRVAGTLIGFAFFIMMVTGGIKFLMSGGDPKAVNEAKGALTWGIVGLAIFALSYTILLLIEAFTGVPVTIFKIGSC